MSLVNPVSNNYLQSFLSSAIQDMGLSTNNNPGSSTSVNASSLSGPADSSQVSPHAELMSTRLQLQHADPSKYEQVTEQIAVNPQEAAQTSQSQGNTSTANELNQLSSVFSQVLKTASFRRSGFAKAPGRTSQPSAAVSSDSDANASSSTTPTSSASSTTNPFAIAITYERCPTPGSRFRVDRSRLRGRLVWVSASPCPHRPRRVRGFNSRDRAASWHGR
jgi:hypothetical protein